MSDTRDGGGTSRLRFTHGLRGRAAAPRRTPWRGSFAGSAWGERQGWAAARRRAAHGFQSSDNGLAPAWGLQPGQAGGFLCLREAKIGRRERRKQGRSKALPLAGEHAPGSGGLQFKMLSPLLGRGSPGMLQMGTHGAFVRIFIFGSDADLGRKRWGRSCPGGDAYSWAFSCIQLGILKPPQRPPVSHRTFSLVVQTQAGL